VRAAVLAGRRRIDKLMYLEKHSKREDLQQLLGFAKRGGIPTAVATRQQLDRLTDGRSHQGVVLECTALPVPKV